MQPQHKAIFILVDCLVNRRCTWLILCRKDSSARQLLEQLREQYITPACPGSEEEEGLSEPKGFRQHSSGLVKPLG